MGLIKHQLSVLSKLESLLTSQTVVFCTVHTRPGTLYLTCELHTVFSECTCSTLVACALMSLNVVISEIQAVEIGKQLAEKHFIHHVFA